MSDDLLPTETLERLSRQEGVDTRPILVRVLTDLFIQKDVHTPDEVARYEELVSGLLDVVGVDARAAVARRLADDARAPSRLVERLIADDVAVSTPILSRFPGIQRETLLAVALDGGPAEASAVASRLDVDSDLIRILARHADDLVVETLAANGAARFGDHVLAALVERAGRAPGVAAALLRRTDLDPAALAPLYLEADPDLRAKIRAALEEKPLRSAAARPTRDLDVLDAAMLTAATETGKGGLIAEALGTSLLLRPDDAARLANEPSGEAFVLMLRAAGVDSDLVARAILVAQPEIAVSVVRFFHLIEIAETTSRASAGAIVTALVGDGARAARPVRHEPALDPSGVMERAGAARTTAAPRPAARPEIRRTLG